MTCIRRRAAIGYWAVLLLILTVSPLTAPFSPCSLQDLLGKHEMPGGELFHSKPLKDGGASAAADWAAELLFFEVTAAVVVAWGPSATAPRRRIPRPLRV